MKKRRGWNATGCLKARAMALAFGLVCLAGALGGRLSAQTVERAVLSAGGSTQRQTLGQGGTPCLMTWTIGEPLNETYAGSKKILSQGFLQGKGYIRDTVGMDTTWNWLGTEAVARMVEVLCYPNPTSGPLQVWLKSLGACEWTVEAELTDMNGRRLYRPAPGRLPWQETLDLSAYPAGTYLLKLRLMPVGDNVARRAEAVGYRTYQIIKH